MATQTKTETEELLAPNPGGRLPREKVGRQRLRTKGWQVVNIPENVRDDDPLGLNFVQLAMHQESGVRINCYAPGASDEMHCHPGSEHTFLVWKGKLHIRGIEEGEDIVVGPGEFVHIDAGYYYRLHNPGPEPAVYCQFHTIRARKPKKEMVFFSESARGKREAATS